MAPASYAPQTLFGLECLLIAISFLAFGYLGATAVGGRWLSTSVRWGLAFPFVVGYTLLLMLVHIATRGALFSNPWVVRGVTASCFIVFAALTLRGRSRNEKSPRTELCVLAAIVIIALAVWGSPVWRMLPLDSRGDTVAHTGWTMQILNGQAEPGGLLSGPVPNGYPWLFHSLLALVTLFTPGAKAYFGLSPLHLLQVAGGAATFFALGKELTGKWLTAAGAALFCTLTGGFGFLISRAPALVTGIRGPDALRYGGDLLVKRGYNLSLANLPPPFPRDLAYDLFPCFLLMVIVGFRTRKPLHLVVGGVALGLMGLAGAEAFIVGLGVAVLVSLWPMTMRRASVAAALLLPALALWALWVVPLLINFERYGGFKSLAASPITLPAHDFLVAWGVTAIMAVVGGGEWLRRLRSNSGVRVASAVVLSSGAIIASSAIVPAILGQGFATLERDHRYWPLMYAGLALFAALGLTTTIEASLKRSRLLAAIAGLLVLGLALPSPIFATVAYPKAAPPNAFVAAALGSQKDSVLHVVASLGDQQEVLAVPPMLQHEVFSFTGYPLVALTWSKGNFGFVRFRDILDHVGSKKARRKASRALTSEDLRLHAWIKTARRWKVDAVVRQPGAPVRGLARCDPRVAAEGYVVIFTRSCPA